MLGKILGIVFLLFVFLFTICSCVVAKRSDDWEEKENEKRNNKN